MSNLPAVNPAALGTALAAASQRTVSLDTDGIPFLRLLKSGDWVYSADDIDVQGGSIWAVNPTSFMEGFVAWGEGELLGEEMAPMTGTPIIAADLPEKADAKRGWERQVGFMLLCLNGDDKGTQVMYKTSSKGGTKAVRGLVNDVVNQINEDPTNIVPRISLEVDSYKHKQYGKIYTPVFTINEWGGFDEVPAAPAEHVDGTTAMADAAVEEKTEPVKKRRRAIAS